MADKEVIDGEEQNSNAVVVRAELPEFEIIDSSIEAGANPLNANENNIVEGGRFVVGDMVQNGNGEVIGRIKRTDKKKVSESAEAVAATTATINPDANAGGAPTNKPAGTQGAPPKEPAK